MAWIAKSDGVDGYFSLAAEVTASVNSYIEIKFKVIALTGTFVRLASGAVSGSNTDRIIVENNGNRVIVNSGGGTSATWTSVFAGALTVGQIITIRVTTNGTTSKTLTVDGVSKGTASTDFSSLGRWRYFCVNNGEYSNIGLFYVTYVDNLNSANNLDLQPDSSSHGTGTAVIVDIANGRNATAVNLPTDGAVWEDLGSGGTSYSNSLASGAVSATGSSISASRWYYSSLSGGNFSLTGGQLQQLIQIARDISSGAVTVSGQAISSSLQFDRSLSQGVVSITGNQILSAANYSRGIQSGTITINGQGISAFKGVYSSLQSGAASIAGVSIPVTVNYSRSLQSGALSLFGYSISSGLILNASLQQGSVSLSGYSITTSGGFVRSLSAGALSSIGGDIQSNVGITRGIQAGIVSVTGAGISTYISTGGLSEVGKFSVKYDESGAFIMYSNLNIAITFK